MKRLPLASSVAALFLAGCAATSDTPTMSPAELSDCLQPNRRVIVEVVGRVVKPPAKKPAAKPQEAAAKPAAPAPKPQAAAAPAKPAKPELIAFEEKAYVQGNTAFDVSGAALKDGGRTELDSLVALLKKRAVQVGAIIISGHTDRTEAASGSKTLSEDRAKSVKDYLVSQGLDEKLIFWEGKEAKEAVPVTKFCS